MGQAAQLVGEGSERLREAEALLAVSTTVNSTLEVPEALRLICREGARVGVKTPFNDAVVAIVRGLGVGFQSDRAHLDPVIRMLPG